MKLIIVSDGTMDKTEIMDTTSGQVLENVTRIEITADAKQGRINAVIYLTDVELALRVDDVVTKPPTIIPDKFVVF